MTTYKQKTKQYVVNAARQPIYLLRDDAILFNLNACFVKKNNYTRFETILKEAVSKGGKSINLGNLASLCYKLEMDYCSRETLDFVQKIVDICKKEQVGITQDNVKLYGEVDMQPFDNLISYDRNSNIIYTNHVLVSCLKILGYVDSQIREVVDFTKDFRTVIPDDLVAELPIANRKTNKAYVKIKGILEC